MIIATYAGCGKTTFAKKHSDICVEIASMPYVRILPIVKEETTGEFEGEKAAYYHVNNPIYPYNMIADILEQEKIDILRQEICKKKQNVWLAIRFFLNEVFYQIKDIDNPEERQFVYNFGKRLYASMEVPSIFSYDFDIREEAKKLHYTVRTVDKDELVKALEKHEKKVGRYLKR